MIQIASDNVTQALRSLFRTDEPQARRCFAVLDGIDYTGKIVTNDPVNPTWGVIWEARDGTTYLGGRLDPATLARVFANLRQEGTVLVLLPSGDPRLNLLPPDPDYEGYTLDFYDRPVGKGLCSDRIFGRVLFSIWVNRDDPFFCYIHLLDDGCAFYLPHKNKQVHSKLARFYCY